VREKNERMDDKAISTAPRAVSPFLKFLQTSAAKRKEIEQNDIPKETQLDKYLRCQTIFPPLPPTNFFGAYGYYKKLSELQKLRAPTQNS